MENILITNAYEGNLKHVSLTIPKHQLVVFTGLSGSGKSTLLMDVLFHECQRQYLEAMAMQGIRKPKVDRIQGASPAIIISQSEHQSNPRSTVGTMSDIYTDLRMIYEKLGVRTCPHCGKKICAADCHEETEKNNNDFYVYMYCSECGKRMNKITRTYFSFNTKDGACPTCEGLGSLHTIQKDRVVDESLSLEEGAVLYWEKQYGKYQLSVIEAAFQYYHCPLIPHTPVQNFTPLQKTILYNGVNTDEVKQLCPELQPPKTTQTGKFEGVYPILWRRFADKNGHSKQLEPYFEISVCPDCHGERLSPISRYITILQTRLPELSFYSLEHLFKWIETLHQSLSLQHLQLVEDYLIDIQTKLKRFLRVGLGYLTLDRQIMTLSGGELQRLRLAATLDSELSGIIYILDEPTVGLHPKDTLGLIQTLKKLRDLGNTVLVIEHDIDVMKHADYLIDMGPLSGQMGGEIVVTGNIEDIKKCPTSLTGHYLCYSAVIKQQLRKPLQPLHIEKANQFNLKNVSVDIPTGCLVCITGPSGSGKSTLIFEILAKNKGVQRLEIFDEVIEIGQSPLSKMRRSNVATYSDVYTEIRDVFAKTSDAKKAKLSTKYFSFNTKGGRCENCEGLGYVENNMLFFTDNKVICPICHGYQFQNHILDIHYKGYSIKDILNLSIREAIPVFAEQSKIIRILKLLQDVGLDYLQLGQPLTTLSGGEAQRLKLAKELIHARSSQHNLYLMDEPTRGLHPHDVEHFLTLLNRLIDNGHSVIVVEHNQQMIKNSDWIIDLGPDGGEHGGEIIFCGTPQDFSQDTHSLTAKYL